MVCSEIHPCSASEAPNIENPYEDYLDTGKNMIDECDDDFE
jgi:hypothetical protein